MSSLLEARVLEALRPRIGERLDAVYYCCLHNEAVPDAFPTGSVIVGSGGPTYTDDGETGKLDVGDGDDIVVRGLEYFAPHLHRSQARVRSRLSD